jgi:DNA-binding LytR/AlgR family response regulator
MFREYNEEEGGSMLHIAVVETKQMAKEYVFAIGSILYEYAWSFRHFTSIMEFFKEQQTCRFDLVILHEKFQTERIHEVLIRDKPYTVIFSCEQQKPDQPFDALFFMLRKEPDMERLASIVLPIAKKQEDFFFSYHDVKVMMKIHDIHYIEKQDKYLIYHTVRGEFKERGNMSDAALRFREYGFLHIHASFLVNGSFLKSLEKDAVVLKDQTILPISRSKYAGVKGFFNAKSL